MWRRWGAVAVAGLALASTACGNEVAPGDQEVRPKLPFAVSAQAAAKSPVAPAGEALLHPDRPVEYRLAPGVEAPARSAAAYRVVAEEVDHRRVTRLARALGLEAGGEASEGPTFVVEAGARRLVVEPHGWSYTGEVGGATTPQVAVSCAVGEACPAPPPPAPPEGVPSAAEADKLAQALLSQAGIDLRGAARQQEPDGTDGRTVTFVPQAGGREVVGLETSLTFGAHGRLDRAAGFFGRFESVGEYPLIGLEEAVERHRPGLGGRSAIPEGRTAGGESQPSAGAAPAASGTVEAEVVELTGVELVLEVVEPPCAGDHAYLVPTFAFEPDTVALVPAVVSGEMIGLDPSPAVPESPCTGVESLTIPAGRKPEPAAP